jgi:hypothetical protein
VLAALSSKVAHLPTVEAWKVAGGKLLWWPGGSLLWQWGGSIVEPLLLLLQLLLLKLPWLEIYAIAPNTAIVVVDAADPQVGYTPSGTWEEHR